MKKYSPWDAPIVKVNKLNKFQHSIKEIEREEMKFIPYAYVIGSLNYIHVYMRPDIAFTVLMLGHYEHDPRMEYWKIIKKVMHYL